MYIHVNVRVPLNQQVEQFGGRTEGAICHEECTDKSGICEANTHDVQ